jgi:hypothetical protein
MPSSKRGLPTLAEQLSPAPLPTSEEIMAEETEKWGKVVKFSGAKAD